MEENNAWYPLSPVVLSSRQVSDNYSRNQGLVTIVYWRHTNRQWLPL